MSKLDQLSDAVAARGFSVSGDVVRVCTRQFGDGKYITAELADAADGNVRYTVQSNPFGVVSDATGMDDAYHPARGALIAELDERLAEMAYAVA